MISEQKALVDRTLVLASVLNAGNVVADWNAIGSTTVIANGARSPPRQPSGSPTRASPCTTRLTPLQATTNRSTTGSLGLPTLPSTPPQWPRRIAFWSTISRSQQTALITQFTASLAAIVASDQMPRRPA